MTRRRRGSSKKPWKVQAQTGPLALDGWRLLGRRRREEGARALMARQATAYPPTVVLRVVGPGGVVVGSAVGSRAPTAAD